MRLSLVGPKCFFKLTNNCASFLRLDDCSSSLGRVSVREGNIVLTGCGGCGLYLMPVDTLTFSYSSNGYLVINGVGWQCGLWEPDD